ncbi:MAG: hypothetical protein KDA45_09215 [Planctomycetales bacterium]|nr:hypothetical protein [Planctomycetales bacterium]
MSWQLSDHSAVSDNGLCHMAWAPTAPAQAARIAVHGHQGCVWQAFAVSPLPTHALQPEEIYIRGDDLIAKFGQSASDSYAFQLDWQLLSVAPPVIFGVELWLSVHTALLDTEPAMEVSCSGPAEQRWRCFDHAALSGRGAGEESLQATPPVSQPAALVCQSAESSALWLIEPSDQRHAQLLSEASCGPPRIRLFGHFLEKGVIRRARMRFLICEGGLELAEVARQYLEFAQSELPLTA